MSGFVVLIDSREEGPNVVYPTIPTFRPGGGFTCQGYYINSTPHELFGNGNCSFIREDDALAFAHRVQLLTQGSHWHVPSTVRVLKVGKEFPVPVFVKSPTITEVPMWRHRRRETAT